MNIVVDTSVWSLALRRDSPSDDPQAITLAKMLRDGRPVAILGVILQEVLQGVRSRAGFDRIRVILEAFPLLDLGRDDYVAAAELYNLCRSHGVQATTTDCLIAAVCIRHDCALLTSDQDFQHMARFCPLQIL